jgi:hypothetical protein
MDQAGRDGRSALGHHELPAEDTELVLRALFENTPAPASIDVARLAQVLRDAGEHVDANQFLRRPLESSSPAASSGSADIVLYGFGRIGRLLARILISHAGNGLGLRLRLRAIVVRRGSPDDLDKRAGLLARDSVHGPFPGTVTADHDNNVLIANGVRIKVTYADDPASIDYAEYGIHHGIIVDNTRRWRNAEGLAQHLESKGVARVLLTAPGKSPMKNGVHGVHDHTINSTDTMLSAASCTTNAIIPVLKALHDAYGIERGHVETVHSFTNDQNLIDIFHPGDRRGRSAVLNMVISETGAESGRKSDTRTCWTPDRIQHPSTDTPRLSYRPLPDAHITDDPRRGQRLSSTHLPASPATPADRVHRISGRRLHGLHRLPSSRRCRRSGNRRRWRSPRSLRLVRQRVRVLDPSRASARANGRHPPARYPGARNRPSPDLNCVSCQ